MSKILYNNFQGIKSNYDKKDVGLSAFIDGSNFRVKKGFIEADLDYLESVIPLPTLLTGWQWEKGIYAIITNDKLAEDPIVAKYEVLFLVAKKTSNYQRQFFYSINNGLEWIVLQSDGVAGVNYPSNAQKLSSVTITSSFFIPEVDGDIKLVNSDGILKIYLPHDCFWFGRIERTINLANNDSVGISSFYFDRLVENVNLGILNIDFVNPLTGSYTDYIAAENRRLGINLNITKETTGTVVINGDTGKFILQSETPLKTYVLISNTTQELIGLPDSYRITYQMYGMPTTIKYYDSWTFYLDYNYGAYNKILIPKELIDAGSFQTFTVTVPKTSITNPAISNLLQLDGDYYSILRTDFENNNVGLVNRKTIADNGFTSSDNITSIIVTAILDRKTEIPIYFSNTLYNFTDNFAIKIEDINLVYNGNKRITDIRFYVKLASEPDYLLHQSFDLITDLSVDYSTIYLTKESSTGIYLSQNIGIVIDPFNIKGFEIISGFRDVLLENGIATAILTNDYINVYHCTVGGGKVMTDLFYSSNIVDLPGLSYAKALLGLNGKIGVMGEDFTYVLMVNSVGSNLVYEVIDQINIGTNSAYKIVNTKNGSIVLTYEDIFFLNGYEKKSIGYDIQDIIIANYSTAELYYNKQFKELYFIPNTGASAHYRLRLEEMVWEKIEIAYADDYDITYDRFEDIDGNMVYLMNGETEPVLLTKGSTVKGELTLTTGLESFKKESQSKFIDSITLDYIGSGSFYINFYVERYLYNEILEADRINELNKVSIFFELQPHLTQRKEIFEIPIHLKTPLDYLDLVYYSNDPTFKLYSVELNAEVDNE